MPITVLSDPNTRDKIEWWQSLNEKQNFEASGCSGLSGALFCQKCERSQLSLSTVLKPMYLSKLSKNGGKQIYSVFTFVNPIWIPTNLESIKDCNQLKILFRMRNASMKGSESGRKTMKHVSWSIDFMACHNIACFSLSWLTMAYYDYLILCI